MQLSRVPRWAAPGRIPFLAPPEIHEVLASIGRTEDVRFSPDDTRLAIVGYATHQIYLFSIRIESGGELPQVVLHDYQILKSSALAEPHGVTFLGNDHLLVCNRVADVCVFDLPDPDDTAKEFDLEPKATISGQGLLWAKVKNPGSTDSLDLGDGRHQVVICNNFWNFVSTHTVQVDSSIRSGDQTNLVDDRLRIPDGVSFSRDGKWIAVSNHVDGEVLVYRNTGAFTPTTKPVAVLKGIVCPHGLRFTAEGQVLVADAASQYLHVFSNQRETWSGDYQPLKSLRMIDDDTLYDGKYDTREGGLKGVDIDRSNRILITTHALDPLAFYSLPRLLESPGQSPGDDYSEFCRQRDESLLTGNQDRLALRWTANQRLQAFVRERRRRSTLFQKRQRKKAELLLLKARIRWARASLLDPRGPVVSLTTHGARAELVPYAIEAIGSGVLKPSRLILWITDEQLFARPPALLERLKSRGLEVLLGQESGPHSKYWSYVASQDDFGLPMVTADDDCLYSSSWLQDLYDAWKSDPQVIHCHRVRRMELAGPELTPYNSWTFGTDRTPSHSNFITGVGGVIYPPQFLEHLKRQGRAFEQSCARNDDIWLTVNAIRSGFPVAQIRDEAYHPATILGSQASSLYQTNVLQGANQRQLRQTFRSEDLDRLRPMHESPVAAPA